MEERIDTAEIEKPFRCTVCSARFTNEDHLQVHKRRHEMSLNFTKSGPITSVQEGFIDETPTPSRFIRNCEEVGLFQDLNPFDEQFSKAASATPTSENNFGFQFSHKTADSDDTLNTPQVLGYTAATATAQPFVFTTNVHSRTSQGIRESNNTCRILEDTDGSILPEPTVETQNELTKKSMPSSPVNHVNVVVIPNIISDLSKTNKVLSCKKQKSNLKLNIESTPTTTPTPLKVSPVTEVISSSEIQSKGPESAEAEKKSELLQRNRAAASRSRERRKKWISALEGKCEGLQTDMAKVYSELSKLRAENKILKLELAKHINCNVTQSQSLIRTKPTILRQVSQAPKTVIVSHSQELKSPLINTVKVVKVFQTPQIQNNQPPKLKRGRPRKGCEKRVSIVQDIPVSKNAELQKVQIVPLFSVQKSNSAQKVFILHS